MPFHAIVCIKSVIRQAPNGVGRRTPDNSELNPFDRPALEAALQLKQSRGGTVTALSMGPPVGIEALAEARAMGADQGILISDPSLAGSDTLVTARVLAAAIKSVGPYDIVFFGTRSSDSDTGQVGPQTATLLEVPFLGGVKQIQAEQNIWHVRRLMDDWEEQYELTLPAVLTIHPTAYAPRPIALGGIAEAYTNENDVAVRGLSDIDLTPAQVGLTGSPTRVSNLQKIKQKRASNMLEGEPKEQVEALIEYLTTKGVIGS